MVIICTILQIYVLILIARAVTSWFPVAPGGGFAQVVGVLHQLTEPVLAPFRRIIPPIGMFDVSFIVVFILIELLSSLICGGGGLI